MFVDGTTGRRVPDRAGREIGRASPTPETGTLSIGPGQSASTALGVASMTLGNCRPVRPARLRITLSGSDAVTVPAGDFAFCPGEIAGVRNYWGPYDE